MTIAETILQWHRERCSVAEIAAATGYSGRVVRGVIRAGGWPMAAWRRNRARRQFARVFARWLAV